MTTQVRIAVRDWDYLTPLLLGDIVSDVVEPVLTRVATLPGDLPANPHYDAAELSLSRYVQAIARGDDSVFGIPVFLMRGFRHRCVITCKDGPIRSFEALRGGRIGLTGWQDSGNIWTRAALAEAGVDMEQAHWLVGRLTANHPVVDRIGRYRVPGLIDPVPDERPMNELLSAGELDAVLTPFMPPEFHRTDTPFRHVLDDYRSAELDYFRRVGFVPGIHILGLRRDLAAHDPRLPAALMAMFDQSWDMWLSKRGKYAETTPWMIAEIERTERDLPSDWKASGLSANREMVEAFVGEMQRQNLIDCALSPEELFPETARRLEQPA